MHRILLAVFLMCFVIGALYAEDFTTLDGDHYSSATIKRVEPDGLVIAYSDGVKKLKFRNLPPEIGKQYGYNPAVESQYLAQQQASAAASYQAAMQSTRPSIPPNTASASNPSLPIQAGSNVSLIPQQSIPQSTVTSRTTSLVVVQPTAGTPITPSIFDSFNTFFANIYIYIKNQFKTFLIKWLHILFPWAFPPPSVYLNSTTTYAVTSTASNTPKTTNTPPPTPHQIIDGVLSKEIVQATELANIIERFPQQTIEKLNTSPSKLFNIDGIVESFIVTGPDQERVELKLVTDKLTHIYIYLDLKRDNPDVSEEWKIIDQRLFLITKGSRATTDLICIEGGYLPNLPKANYNGFPVRLKSFSPNPLSFTPYTLNFKLQR